MFNNSLFPKVRQNRHATPLSLGGGVVVRPKLLAICLLLVCAAAHAQGPPILHPGRVIFYNVENLFDTINDPNTKDEEFLPQARNAWNTQKYKLKVKHLAHVLATMIDTIQPMVIGLAEIENKKVLQDLIAQPELKQYSFGIIQYDSPDERGIDVAFLYNKDLVEVVLDSKLTVNLSGDKTRDIVYLKCYVNEGEPIWIFVNHWPSRRGGTEESDAKRLAAEKVLQAKIENLYLGERFARVIVMGDFNDNPTDKSVSELLTKKSYDPKEQDLQNLMLPIYKSGQYTLKYKDENDVFDQFIVSKNLLSPKSPYFIRGASAHIYNPEWLLFKHPKYGWVPNRTYASGKWVGGYSDHLPVYLDIVFK